jgi:very-short-patch-repair endonuclease
MEKIEYITNQLKKTFGKKYENYCVTRIYSLINRNDVKIVTQQLFKRKGKNIALADLYFPQINLWVEIDEGHHENQIQSDKDRTKEVIEMNKIPNEVKKKYEALEEVINPELEEPYRIVVYNKSLDEINKQIDVIVEEINNRIAKLGEDFVPWINVNSNPEEFISKGVIKVSDNAKFKTIDTIGKLFNIEKVPFNQKLHGYINIDSNIYYWCPTLKIVGDECDNNAWENEISEDGNTIFENQKEKSSHYISDVLNEKPIRYIFTKYKDETGSMIYKFKGVFDLDEEETVKTNKRTWKKISDEIDLKQYFN